MRFPEFLKKNGTIGFVAPSFGCNIEPYKTSFNHALEKFHEMGYQTTLEVESELAIRQKNVQQS